MYSKHGYVYQGYDNLRILWLPLNTGAYLQSLETDSLLQVVNHFKTFSHSSILLVLPLASSLIRVGTTLSFSFFLFDKHHHWKVTMTLNSLEMAFLEKGNETMLCTVFNPVILLFFFPSVSSLDRHMQTHHGHHKPFRCKICSFKSSYNSRLKTHILKAHAGESVFMMPSCLSLKSSGLHWVKF